MSSNYRQLPLIFTAHSSTVTKPWCITIQSVKTTNVQNSTAYTWLIKLVGPLATAYRTISFPSQPFYGADKVNLMLLRPNHWFSIQNFFQQQTRGLARGHHAELIIRGIGLKFRFYRRNGQRHIAFRLGYAHRILYPVPPTVQFLANKRFDFLLHSLNQAQLRANSELVRSLRCSDIYKGKGIKYDAAPLVLKLGKVR